MNNFNSLKTMDKAGFNSASFEELKKMNYNNDISLSNPTLSKNLINNSNLAVNHSNQNNQIMFDNNSNLFNLNNNNKMNVFNNNIDYNNMMNNNIND